MTLPDNKKGIGPKGRRDVLTELKDGPLKPKAALKPLHQRLIDFAEIPEGDSSVLYQHSVLCQTCLPYRDRGDDVRLWARRNGWGPLDFRAKSAGTSCAKTWEKMPVDQ